METLHICTKYKEGSKEEKKKNLIACGQNFFPSAELLEFLCSLAGEEIGNAVLKGADGVSNDWHPLELCRHISWQAARVGIPWHKSQSGKGPSWVTGGVPKTGPFLSKPSDVPCFAEVRGRSWGAVLPVLSAMMWHKGKCTNWPLSLVLCKSLKRATPKPAVCKRISRNYKLASLLHASNQCHASNKQEGT